MAVAEMTRPPEGAPAEPAQLSVSTLSSLPERVAVGGGQALFIDGSCSAGGRQIRSLRIRVADREEPVRAFGMPPPGSRVDSEYWWAIATVAPVSEPTMVWVELVAELDDGTTATGRLGTIELVPSLEPPPESLDEHGGARPEPDATGPLVAICMATYEPPIELFRRQIDSIRDQTHRNWICLLSDDGSSPESLEAMREVLGDDGRFLLSPAPTNRGFFRNFERALTMVPQDAEYVALSDQDDRWHPDKLASLLDGLEPGDRLVYSDMRIIDEDGSVLSDTYWSFRRNNHTDFGSLLIANTVTGAASLFDRGLLDDVLPFPPPIQNAYHDHWIAQVAMALGGISYVDRPLYDYVQHQQAALGHFAANAFGRYDRSLLSRLRAIDWRTRRRQRQLGWRNLYFGICCRVEVNVAILRMRCGSRVAPARARTLKHFGDRASGYGWLLMRAARSFGGRNETLGRERVMLAGFAWRRYARLRRKGRLLLERGAGVMPRPARRAKPVAWTSGGAEAEPTEWLRPILVDYFTRDGSTLMMRLLSSSPEIAVELSYPYERKYFAYLWRWSQLLDMPEWPEAQWSQSNLASIADRRHSSAIVGPPPWYPRPLIGSVPGEPTMAQRTFELVWSEFSRRAARERVSELGKAGAGTEVKYFAEKHLNTWKVATEQLPQVQVIALLRDPRDSWISINAFNEAKGNGALGRDQAGSAERHLENFLKRQRERMRWIAEIERGGDVPVVRYDRLVTDIDSVAAELGERLGVSFDTEQVVGDRSLRARHVTANSPERSVGRWREEMDPELARIFWQELGPELSALGFSAD